MLSGQMANRFGFRQNFNCQAFRSRSWAATAWVDSFLQSRLEDTTPNNEYLDQCHSPQISLLVAFPQSSQVLPAFEPCLLQFLVKYQTT